MAIGFKLTGPLIFLPIVKTIDTLITVLYFGFSYSTFMNYQSRTKGFFKGIGVSIVSMLIYILSFTIVAMIIVALLKYLSPDTFDMIRPSNNR